MYKGATCGTSQDISGCPECVKGVGTGTQITTTPSPSKCWNKGKNPCNFGTCTISSISKHGYLCFCAPGVAGKGVIIENINVWKSFYF